MVDDGRIIVHEEDIVIEDTGARFLTRPEGRDAGDLMDFRTTSATTARRRSGCLCFRRSKRWNRISATCCRRPSRCWPAACPRATTSAGDAGRDGRHAGRGGRPLSRGRRLRKRRLCLHLGHGADRRGASARPDHRGLGAPLSGHAIPSRACSPPCGALGVSRIGWSAPMSRRVGAADRDLLGQRSGVDAFRQLQRLGRGARRAYRARVDPGGRAQRSAHGDCEAVFLSCTNLRTLGVIDPIEAAFGKPVLSSNVVLAWHLAQLAGVAANARIPGALGRL
jgi:hypothetical protein